MKKLITTFTFTSALLVAAPLMAVDAGPCNYKGLNGLVNSPNAIQTLISRETNAGKGNGGELDLFFVCLSDLPGDGPIPGDPLGDPGNSGDNNNAGD